MPRIRCHYIDCVFLDEGYCSAGQIELDPDTGCKTYSANVGPTNDENWDDDNDEEELEEWEEGDEDEDDDIWGEDETESDDV